MSTLLKEKDVSATEEQVAEATIGRRVALKWVAGIAGSLSALIAGLPSLFAFMTPAVRTSAELRWVRLGEAALFDIGVPDRVDFTDNVKDAWVNQRVVRSVWVHTEDGESFTVYNSRCPHLGCAYSFDEEHAKFGCPCHNGIFDVKTGAVVSGPPPRGLDKLQTKVEDGYVFAAYEDFRLGSAEKIRV